MRAFAPRAALFACSFLTLHAASQLALSSDGLTVYDSVNNITWLADANLPASNRFTLPICSNSNTKTCVNTSGSMNYPSATVWVAAMNAANYLGHNNWQLPTTPLVDGTCGKTGPNGGSFGFGCTAGALDTTYNALGFKPPDTAVAIPSGTTGPFSNLQPYLYWTQTPAASAGSGNTSFSFATGFQGANTLPNFLYVWPMIPGKIAGTPAAAGTALQVNPGGQSVYDPETNITWTANANLAATNTFGLPQCTSPTSPALCVAQDGSMTYASATQFIANMNSAAYLGQTQWQLPPGDASCGFGCDGTSNPMGNLYYDQLGLRQGTSAVTPPAAGAPPFSNLQPYLYWTCLGNTIQDPCETTEPADDMEESYSFGAGFQGTDLLANNLYVTAYFVGSRTAQAGPVIAEVANAEQESPTIAPNTWIEIKGANLAGTTYVRQNSDLVGGQMPTQLKGLSVTVNGKNAYMYYVSPAQIDVLTPPDPLSGSVQVVVTDNGVASAPFDAQAAALSPSFFMFNGGPYVIAQDAIEYNLLGPASLSVPGYPFTPAQPGEIVTLWANGFGPTNMSVVSGSDVQGGTLSTLPSLTIGGVNAQVSFAGLIYPSEFQINVTIPANTANGDQPIVATYGGASTPAGALITVQR